MSILYFLWKKREEEKFNWSVREFSYTYFMPGYDWFRKI